MGRNSQATLVGESSALTGVPAPPLALSARSLAAAGLTSKLPSYSMFMYNAPGSAMRKYAGQVFGLLVFSAFATVGAQGASAGYTVKGVIYDDASAPIPNARLSLSREGEASRLFETGADGKFSFDRVSPGPVTIKARRIGYRITEMRVDVDATTSQKSFALQMAEVPSEVADVIVEGSKGHLREFYEHKNSNNFGKFFEQKDIDRLAKSYVSEVLRTVAGATLQASERTGNHVLLRGCKPTVWVDGVRAADAEIDEVARPSDVAGMEVYPSWAGLPIQYQERDNRMCGVVVLWTRGQ
jgi:hypothetical protein